MGRRAAAWGAMLVVVLGIDGAGGRAQAGQPAADDLPTLLTAIHATGTGVQEWLDRLAPGLRVSGSAAERLLAVTVNGQLLASVDGASSHVALGPALDEQCQQPGAGIVLVHNHPSSTGLSADDLSQLAKPGVAAIVAIGHDGSIYSAAAARRYPAGQFVEKVYTPARADADKEMRVQRTSLADARLADWMPHVMALALAKAGVIEYQATLAADRLAAFQRDRTALGRVIAAAEHRAAAVVSGR